MNRRNFLNFPGVALVGLLAARSLPGGTTSGSVPTPATIDELVHAMESMFPVDEPTRIHVSVTGEPYVTFEFGCKSASQTLAGFERKAVAAHWQEFLNYAARRPPGSTLYWRCKPQLEHTVQGFYLYSRLLLSNA